MNSPVNASIGHIINLRRGHDLTQEEMISGNYPVVGSNGIIGYHNDFTTKKPCLTVGRSGSVGKINFFDTDCWAHNTTLYVDDFKGNNPKYVYYLLKNLDFAYLHSGSVVPSLNRNYIHPLIIPYYSNTFIQQRIASVLSSLDAKIELNNRINAELESMAKTLYDYWFVQFDFPDKNGKPYKSSGGKMVWNEELKREIPEGWEVKELNDIITRSGTGLNPRDNFQLGRGTNYYITIRNVKNGKIFFDNSCDRVDDEALKIIDNRSDLQVGDILFTSIEPVGVTYFIHEKPKNWNINESVFTIRPNYEIVTSEYLFMLLSSTEMKSYTKNVSAGSIHKGIRHTMLKKFKLSYNNIRIIEQFSQVIGPILKRINSVNNENTQLCSLRDWLLPMMMNGQVKVD